MRQLFHTKWTASFLSGLSALAVLGTLIVAPGQVSEGHPALKTPTTSHPLDLNSRKPMKGRFLVAARSMKDPRFSETVILLIECSPRGAAGLIINQPTETRLSAVLPEIPGVKNRSDVVHVGGPVNRTQMLLLVRSRKQPRESTHLLDDVYVSASRSVLQEMLDLRKTDKHLRVYAGYAGWAPGQLEREISRGDWHVIEGATETVFEKQYEDIWPDLIRRGAVQWVRLSVNANHIGSGIAYEHDSALPIKSRPKGNEAVPLADREEDDTAKGIEAALSAESTR